MSVITALKTEGFKNVEFGHYKFFEDGRGPLALPTPHNQIVVRGKNGSGKTSLLEAIIFALTGFDLSGRPKPTHFIKRGSESLKTTLWFGSDVVTRTLTRKGNGTFRIDHASGSVTQTAFRSYLGCDEESVLAAVVPGFFMRQSDDRRKRLISKSFEAMSKKTLVAQVDGVDLEWAARVYGDLDESFPSVSKVQNDRLAFDKTTLRPAEKTLEDVSMILSEVLEEPRLDPSLAAMEKEYAEEEIKVAQYQKAITSYAEMKSMRLGIQAQNERVEKRREMLLKAISEVWISPVVEVDWSEFEALKEKLLEYPKKPESWRIPSEGRCHACGNVVGIDHRKTLMEKQARDLEMYNAELARIEAENKPILEKMDHIHSKLSVEKDLRAQAVRRNEANEVKKKQWEAELHTLQLISMPPEPLAPKSPERRFTEEDLKKNSRDIQSYYKKLGAFEAKVEARERASRAYPEASRIFLEAKAEHERLEAFEHATKALPSLDFHARKKAFDLPLYEADISEDEEFDILFKGIPYDSLSSGEKMRVDLAICFKFHEALRAKGAWRLPAAVFFDNADLADIDRPVGVSEFLGAAENLQVFEALVDNCPLTVEGKCTLTTSPKDTSPQLLPF